MRRVAWLGGGTGSGKTSVTRSLAARHGLRVLAVDAFWYAHAERLGEPQTSPEAQWLGSTPEQQAAEFESTSRRRLALVLDDLASLPERPTTLVEGPQVVPDMLPPDATAVFLVPTPELQRSILSRRPLPDTSDPGRALENRIRKDVLFAGRIASLARAHGFPVIAVDGTVSVEGVVEQVEHAFGDSLRADGDGVDLHEARHWENEVAADNIARWLDSADVPVQAELTVPFACECGKQGCAEQSMLTLEVYRATRRLLSHPV